MALEENLASDAPTLSHSCLRTSWSCRLGQGVRAGSWPCSQLLLGPQGRENEGWHLLLGGEAPPPGCDRREPLKEDPRPSPSSREHLSAPEQVCAQTVSKRFRGVSFQPSNPLNRRQGDRCEGRCLPLFFLSAAIAKSCPSTNSVFLNLRFLLLTSVPAARAWPIAVFPRLTAETSSLSLSH